MHPERPAHPAETMSADERAALQTDRLRAMVDRLLAAGGVQGRRLREAGVGSGAEVGLGDLPDLPTTNKRDLWDNYPFGMATVPLDDCVCVHGSSGTSGRPTLVPYTANDLRLLGEVVARSLAGAGATPSSIVHNAYGYGLFTGGMGIHQGGITLGATVVPMSGGMTARQLRVIQDLRPDVLTCTPSYALYLGEAFAAEGIGPEALPLKVGVHGAEPWTEAMRGRIEELLGLRALDIYGLSEIIGPGVACETPDSGGRLHVMEDHFYVEALDPDGGRPVPDGTPGELTFTSLTREAMPLLRYRSGDIASLSRKPSPDGRTTVTMSKIIGRRDDMLVVRGVNVYPTEIEAVVVAEPAAGPQYLLVVDRRAALPGLIVCCEAASAAVSADVLAGRLGATLKERLSLTCTVHVLPPGGLPRTETGKAIRVTHWTEGPPPLPALSE